MKHASHAGHSAKKAKIKKAVIKKVARLSDSETLVDVELHVEGAPDVPHDPLPQEIELSDTSEFPRGPAVSGVDAIADATEVAEAPKPKSGWVAWLKSLWE